MQAMAQLSTLSRETEAPSLSSCSVEKKPYTKARKVKEILGEIAENYIWLHAYYNINLE
jgi:hypothetical protein